MKKLYIILLALFLVNGACQRSQFSTTTRHSSNGKVTYVNHYPAERSKSSKFKYPKNHLTETKAQNNSMAPDRTGVVNLPEPEITTINPAPMSDYENLIASTSSEPAIIAEKKEQNSLPDTLKSNMPKMGTTNDSITQQVIKFKNGQKETVRITSQSRDTLKYELLSEQGVVRFVMMEQVDTILLVKISNPIKAKVADTRKTEPLGKWGFISSLIGFIPLIGIPFALLAIVFGAVSLHKIHRHPEKFNTDKGFAYASLFLGILGIAFSIIMISLFQHFHGINIGIGGSV
jgi:hypothetical protein